jgi:prevent-host-death family protein
MRTVGIRELKNRLSEYVRAVEGGETVLVTDRGRVVAELRPFDPARAEGLPAVLSRLVASGSVRLPEVARDTAFYGRRRRVAPPGTAARLLAEDRGDS